MAKDDKKGPKYFINFEGTNYDWNKDTITVNEIRELVGINNDKPIVEIDFTDNSERELDPKEVVDLKPGKGFSRKVGFKRG